MGNEPDEMQQMIHMIACSNEFEIEGLIAVTGKYLRPDSHLGEYNRVTHPELFHAIIDEYSLVWPKLKEHAPDYPDPKVLRSKVATGQKGYGFADVKVGNSSEGSKLIIDVVTKADDRPVWVAVNAGSNTLAQALVDYQADHTAAEFDAFVAKLRVFENGSQDNAGAWICSKFPRIHWIRSNFQTYAYGGPNWKKQAEGLGPHDWEPFEYTTKGQLDWQNEHIRNNHGALGALYPERVYHAWGEGVIGFMEGGGTIPWMGLVNKGLFNIDQPSWGGWSGRFTSRKTKNFWSRHQDIKADEETVAPFYVYSEASDHWVHPRSKAVYNDNYAPVWRWREAMYNDFKARMDWCVTDYEDANHHPIAAFRGDKSQTIVRLTAEAGETVALDASASYDPDLDLLSFNWWQYQEAGTYPGQVLIRESKEAISELVIPSGAGGTHIHIILEINDTNAVPKLFAYRRIVIDVMD